MQQNSTQITYKKFKKNKEESWLIIQKEAVVVKVKH